MPTDPVNNSNTQPNFTASTQSKALVNAVLIFFAIILVFMGVGLYTSEGRFLLQLQETAVSRGLITFLVAVITVSIALAITVWVIASNADAETTKARFSYAKDVLATLVGILGTILGFYFGSADKPVTEQLAVAEFQFKSGQIITHVSGGVAPYRFTVTSSESEPKQTTKVSRDGWIFDPIPSSLKVGSAVTIEVVDSKDRKASRTLKYQLENAETPTTFTAPGQRTTQSSGQGAASPQLPSSPASR